MSERVAALALVCYCFARVSCESMWCEMAVRWVDGRLGKQTGRQTDGEMARQTNVKMARQTDGETARQTNGETARQTGAEADRSKSDGNTCGVCGRGRSSVVEWLESAGHLVFMDVVGLILIGAVGSTLFESYLLEGCFDGVFPLTSGEGWRKACLGLAEGSLGGDVASHGCWRIRDSRLIG